MYQFVMSHVVNDATLYSQCVCCNLVLVVPRSGLIKSSKLHRHSAQKKINRQRTVALLKPQPPKASARRFFLGLETNTFSDCGAEPEQVSSMLLKLTCKESS